MSLNTRIFLRSCCSVGGISRDILSVFPVDIEPADEIWSSGQVGPMEVSKVVNLRDEYE